MGAGADNDGLCQILALAAEQPFHVAGELRARDHIITALRSEFFGLPDHARDQRAAAFPLDELTGIVFDLIRHRDLTAGLRLFDQEGIKTRSAGIKSGCQTCRTAAEDRNVINLFHVLLPPVIPLQDGRFHQDARCGSRCR